jgi:uncharacterized protein YchJ
MIGSGRNVSVETVESMLRRRDEALPFLIDIVKSDRYWRSDGVEAWAPISAMHLLALIGGGEALDAVVYATYNYTEEMGDWLTEDLPSILAHFGADAYGTLLSTVNDDRLEPFARNSAARALHAISRKDQNLRKQAVDALKNAIMSEKDCLARTLLVDVLIEFKDPDTLQFVRSLFEKELIDTSTLTIEEVEGVYAGEYDDILHRDDVDPMDLFRKKAVEYMTPVDSDMIRDEAKFHHGQQAAKKRKIGRNEPCPCGSGKKYKKCCLRKVLTNSQ